MRYVFFSTPEFAAIVLEQLMSAGIPPVAIVTNPDRPTGRKKELTPPPVKLKVQSLKLKVDILQPEELDASFAQQLESYSADVFVVAAYGKILPDWLIKMPPKGVVGVHPSLLPKYRGASPIQSSILNGDKITGTTIFVLDEKVDHGPVLSNKELEIEDKDNYESLMMKLAKESGKLLAETLPKYLNKEIAPHPQNEDQATYTKKFKTEDAFIDLEQGNPKENWLKIKALNPEPGTWTLQKEQPTSASAKASARQRRIKILDADFVDGKLIIKKIQQEGKKPSLFF